MSKQSLGTYSVSKSNSYKCGWRLRVKYFVEGKPKTEVVPISAWQALGFSLEMSIEQARSRASQLNTQNNLEREKIRKAASNVIRINRIESAFLPKHLVEEFESQILGRRYAGDRHKKKMASHWRKLQGLISDLELTPDKYADNAETIYDWFIERQVSLEYTLKLISLLNRWGLLCSKKEGKFFEAVPMPRGRDREMIADAYYNSKGYRGESDPLTPLMLESKRKDLSDKNYYWLLWSVWFGLRPQEIDVLSEPNDKLWYIEHNLDLGVDVLCIYQPKLVTIERSKRWKRIPAFLPQQMELLTNKHEIKAPLYKTMQKVFEGRVTLYGGRKNFEDLMKSYGQDLVDIAQWMGHQNIERTYTKYRNKTRVSFTKVKKSG